MLDPAMLHLPTGEFVVVDLSVLRRRLPADVRNELDDTRASRKCAAALWARTFDSYEQRAFFRAALEARTGFSVRRISVVQDALEWLQRHRAVLRWYYEDGSHGVRISVHDADDDVVAVHHPVDGDVQRSLISAVADLSSQLAAQAVT